ncbi:hypothetical protein HID58_057370 [Brassica napus]|uniref:Uncharacterized protein n=1 Tax=Brassica napus TaxID=3708 RepID=A0ABQ8AQW9_BRANA|nr:hypothetical protein HID58_057370 [Brassica napus]
MEFMGLFRHDSSSPQFTFSVTGVHSSTHLFQPFRRVCLGPESRAPSSSSSQAWLVVVVHFVFQPAEPDSSSATPRPVMVKSGSSDVTLLHVSVPLHNTNKNKDEMALSLYGQQWW